jgi:hypothetical protein
MPRAYTRAILEDAATRSGQGFHAHGETQNCPKSAKKPEKTEKNRKKPVETGLLLLTKLFKSRKVNGGGVLSDPHKHRVFRLQPEGVNAGKQGPSAANRSTLQLAPPV